MAIKESHAMLSIVYFLSIILTFIVLIILIIMLIGNYTIVGQRYQKFDKKLNDLINHNITNFIGFKEETNKVEDQVEEKKPIYLYGHPWLMIILVIMTSVTAMSYI